MHILVTFATLCYGTQCSPNHSCTTRGQKLPILGPPPDPPKNPLFCPFLAILPPRPPPRTPPGPPRPPLPPRKVSLSAQKNHGDRKNPAHKTFFRRLSAEILPVHKFSAHNSAKMAKTQNVQSIKLFRCTNSPRTNSAQCTNFFSRCTNL